MLKKIRFNQDLSSAIINCVLKRAFDISLQLHKCPLLYFPFLPKSQHPEALSSSVTLWIRARSTAQPLASLLGWVLYSQIPLAGLLLFATFLGVQCPQFVCSLTSQHQKA